MHTIVPPPIPTNGTTASVPAAVPPRRTWRPTRLQIIVAGVVVLLAIAAAVIWRAAAPASVALVTTPAQTGTLSSTITASGTANPVDTIVVGSQVSGTISEVLVDFNSVVHTGQVLARIDPTGFQAALDQARAQLAQTTANARMAAATATGARASIDVQRGTANAAALNVDVARANAAAQTAAIATAQSNVTKSQSALVLAQVTMTRDAGLLAQGYVAQNAVDADRANLDAAQSTLAGAQAALAQARSQAAAGQQLTNAAASQSQSQAAQNAVTSAQATAAAGSADAQAAAIGIQAAQVQTAEYNLSHTTITSPVNGTVVARGVSLGQTVAASFSTPTLFTIARDLSKMEIDLAVGEPDIGAVKVGDSATFTVLAFPNTQFAGTITQVRQSPTTVSNVVTYTTVLVVKNKEGLLRPGMTANAVITTRSVNDALIVPLQALEWRPSAAVAAAYHLAKPAPAPLGSAAPARASGGSRFGATLGAGATAHAPGTQARIFVQRSGDLVAVPIQIVLTSATQAAVKPLDGTLAANDAVVTGDTGGIPAATSSARATSPFTQSGPSGGGAARALH